MSLNPQTRDFEWSSLTKYRAVYDFGDLGFYRVSRSRENPPSGSTRKPCSHVQNPEQVEGPGPLPRAEVFPQAS